MKRAQALKKVYKCYEKFILENGYSPSYDQVSDMTSLSKSYVSLLVRELIKNGYLERPREYTIKLTKINLD